MNNGKEANGIYIGAYCASKGKNEEAESIKGDVPWTDLDSGKARDACGNRNYLYKVAAQKGWHMYNIYEHHLIARLMFIEYGGSNFQKMLTNGADWRGVHNVCGGTAPFWIDGLKVGLSGDMEILNNTINGNTVPVGKTCGNTWVKDCMHNKGTNFDMGDVFIAKTVERNQKNGSFDSYQEFPQKSSSSCFAISGTYSMDGSYTPCSLSSFIYDGKRGYLGFKLSKYAY